MTDSLFVDLPRNQSPNQRRDTIAHWLCNFILNHVASEWYRRMIEGLIRLGLRCATEDERPVVKQCDAECWQSGNCSGACERA